MTQFEFYKSFQFVIELLIAQAIFVFRFKRSAYFPVKAAAAVILTFTFSYFLPTLSDDPFYISLLFLLIFLFTLVANKLIFDESWLTVAFCCVAGYTTQHFAYELYNLIMTVFSSPASSGFYGSGDLSGIFPNIFSAVMYVAAYAPAYLLFYVLFSTPLRKREPIKLRSTVIFIFAISVLVVDIVLNAVVLKTDIEGAKPLRIVIGIYNILCCFLSMYLQFAMSIRKSLEDKLDIVEQMWHRAAKQYEISKENIELINMKCHDLRYRNRAATGGMSPEERADIEESISIYDSSVKTGNDALDLILTEKSLLCNKNGITINIMADGKQLGFMAKEDIYALFGNMLDNAIEAVKKLDEDKRTVMLNIKAVGEMLVIRESNRFGETIVFENGLPKTRGDERYHGYGVKSIKYICDRYGGDLDISVEDNVFTMNILFLQNAAKAEAAKQAE